jgi:hypothetical protein
MAVRLTSKLSEWANKTEKGLDLAVLEMATDIHRVSGILAPKLTRALVNSGRITRKGVAHYQVSYGSSQVPYARRRHFENQKNPQTLKYLERGGMDIVRNIRRYIRGL